MELHKANLEAQSQAAATAAAILSSSSVNSNINNPAMAAAALSASATTSTPAPTPTLSQPASMTHAMTTDTTDSRQNAFQLWAIQQQQQQQQQHQQQLATSPYFLPTKVQLQHQPVMAASVAAASPIFTPVAPAQQAGGIPASLLGISSAVSPSVPAPVVSTSASSSSLYHVTPKLKGSSPSTGLLTPSATPSSMAAMNCHRGTDKFAPY